VVYQNSLKRYLSFMKLTNVDDLLLYASKPRYIEAQIIDYIMKAMDKIMLGGEDITQDDLVVSKLLGQEIAKYRSLFPHVSAAILIT
jgi:hypothetical protein